MTKFRRIKLKERIRNGRSGKEIQKETKKPEFVRERDRKDRRGGERI